MIGGRLDESLQAMVEVQVIGGGRETSIEAVIDTGFTGYLYLSEQHLDKMDLELIGSDIFELANGDIIRDHIFLGEIMFDGERRQTTVVVTTSMDSMIGTSLLRNRSLWVDYRTGVVEIK